MLSSFHCIKHELATYNISHRCDCEGLSAHLLDSLLCNTCFSHTAGSGTLLHVPILTLRHSVNSACKCPSMLSVA